MWRLRVSPNIFSFLLVAFVCRNAIAASLHAESWEEIDHQGQAVRLQDSSSHVWSSPVPHVLVSVAVLLAVVFGLVLCAGRKQHLSINEPTAGKASNGMAARFRSKPMSDDGEVAKTSSYAARGPSTHDLASEPVLITQSPTVKPRSGSGSANTNQDAATKQDSAAAGGLLAVTVNGNGSEPASQPNASSSNVPSFLGKKFASFNVLHSKWRHRDESTLDRCKGLSKSLENLQDTLPAKDAKRKAPQPPDRPHRQKSAPDVSAPVDSDEDDFEVVQMPSGYEDIEIIPRARTKRVQTTQTAEGKDISAVEKDESEASKLTGAGAAQAIKRFIVSAGRKVSTSTGAESQDATPSAGHSSPQTGIGASGDKKPQGARKELAYDQVTLPVISPPSPDQDIQNRIPNQAYAVSEPLKSPPKGQVKTKSGGDESESPVLSSQRSKGGLGVAGSPVAHRKRSLSQGRTSKKPAQAAASADHAPDTTYEMIALSPSKSSVSDMMARSQENPRRYNEPQGAVAKAFDPDADNDYEEVADMPLKKPRTESNVQRFNPEQQQVTSTAGSSGGESKPTSSAAAPAPTDLYSVVDKKQLPAPTDLYSVVDKKSDRSQLVYTTVSFNGDGSNPTSPPRKPSLPAPSTVYEQIDVDVQPGATKLPLRTVGGSRQDGSDYEDIGEQT